MEKDFMMWILCTNIISCGTNVQYVIFISYNIRVSYNIFAFLVPRKMMWYQKMLIENMISR